MISIAAHAVPTNLSFQTKIFKPDGTALEAASVNFRFTTVDPTGTCILYVEDFNNVDMSASSGLAIFNLGGGTRAYPVGAYTFTNVFNNLQPSFSCQGGGSYSPNVSGLENRKIIAQFNDGTSAGWQTLPAINVNSVPFSNYAGDSQTLAGFPASDFLRITSLPICGGADVLTYDGTNLTCVTSGAAAAADAGAGVERDVLARQRGVADGDVAGARPSHHVAPLGREGEAPPLEVARRDAQLQHGGGDRL